MAAKHRALLIGTSFSAAPIFFELKKRGLHVTACGSLETDPVHQYSDASQYIDYSDREQLLEIVQNGDYDLIVPSCNDYSYLSASWVANKLGYPGFDTQRVAEILHTKKLFREFTHSIALKAPLAYADPSIDPSDVLYPCLVKPVDAFSGRGVTKVGDPTELINAIREAESASRLRQYVIEQYVTGTLHSHSAFIQDGQIFLDFFVDEFCTTYDYQVNCSNHPSVLESNARAVIREEIQRVVSELKLCDGLLHTQFIANADQYWIIECMRRCPGDLYGHLIERSTGVNYTELFVAPFIGERYAEPCPFPNALPYGRHTVSVADELVYFSLTEEIPTTSMEVVQLKNSGQILRPAPDDKLAILVFPFADNQSMFTLTPHLAEMIEVTAP